MQSRQKNIPCTHHSDSIVEESLSEYDNICLFIHSDVLKHIQSCHRVNGRDDGAKEQVLLQVKWEENSL